MEIVHHSANHHERDFVCATAHQRPFRGSMRMGSFYARVFANYTTDTVVRKPHPDMVTVACYALDSTLPALCVWICPLCTDATVCDVSVGVRDRVGSRLRLCRDTDHGKWKYICATVHLAHPLGILGVAPFSVLVCADVCFIDYLPQSKAVYNGNPLLGTFSAIGAGSMVVHRHIEDMLKASGQVPEDEVIDEATLEDIKVRACVAVAPGKPETTRALSNRLNVAPESPETQEGGAATHLRQCPLETANSRLC